MKYRIGLIMIILSYLLIALDIYLSQTIADKYLFVVAICLVVALLILISGIYLTDKKSDNNTKLDKVLKYIALIPVLIIFLPIIIVLVIFSLFLLGDKSFIQKTKPLVKSGYKMERRKEEKRKVYYFTNDKIVLKFIPDEIYDISFDGGNNYIPILESNIGTSQEIEHLDNILYQYKTVDYRDRNLYDPTTEFVEFIIKNISFDKIYD